MRVPLQWLADFVTLEMSVEDLAHRLTMTGLKVEAIERTGESWKNVVIGQVTQIEPHPTSRNPLWVTKVDLGIHEVTIVTGAPNVRLGDKIPVIQEGGVLPHGPDGESMVIERRPMAGIVSEGMLASARELGISDEHSGIYILPPDAPVGRPLRDLMGDDILDIETNPNRPDTLSIIGIAREVAAITQRQITLPDLDKIDDSVEWTDEESIPIEVLAPDLCPRYSALRIDGVNGTQQSPSWMATRLQAAGMRPINLLVDITNYVMLEYGQPMHAFDASRLRDKRIVVRRAQDDEQMRTLDGVDRRLSAHNLVIADGQGPVAIAGVMGGEHSEIAHSTSTIVLESATFEPISVRKTAQSLSLRTESSSRFEKGLPVEQTVHGLQRYLQLLAQTTGQPLKAYRLSDVVSAGPERREVTMPLRDLHRLTGLQIPADRAAEILSLLEFGVEVEEDRLRVAVPFWRRADIELSADVVEEVIRMVGYDEVPSTLPAGTMEPPAPVPELMWEGVVRERLLSGGINESVTHSLTSAEAMSRLALSHDSDQGPDTGEFWARLVPNSAGVYEREAETLPVRLKNPATRDRCMLRVTLVPSLLDAIARNLKETDERVAFFEIARTIFHRAANLPYERRTLALALSGNRRPRMWQDASRVPFNFYDVKGLVEAVLDTLHISEAHVVAAPHPALHPGRSAALQVDGHAAAYFGELHPQVAACFGIEDWPVQVAEIDLDTLFALASDVRVFRPVPRYPAAYRDLAVVVDAHIAAADILRVVRSAGRQLLEFARIFDVYAGLPLPEGKKSIAIGMSFRSPGATLTQEDVADVMAGIVAALSNDLQATVRE